MMQKLTRILSWSALAVAASVAARWIFLRFRRITLVPTAYTTPPITREQVAPQMRRIIVSDIHLGAGDRLDDFTSDAEFAAFVDQYVSAEPTELILAGDTVEFLQVRPDDVDDDDWSEAASVRRLDTIIGAHQAVFDALGRFARTGAHQVTFLIGNHDFELHYPAIKARIREVMGLEPDDPRLRFGLRYEGGGIYLVHGNQFDPWNRFVHFEGITEPFEVVRGSQLVKEVINYLEDDPLQLAPLIDNVKPSSAMFWYMMGLPRLRKRASRRFVFRGIFGFLQVVMWPTPHHMPITGKGPGGILSSAPFGGLWQAVARLRRRRAARQREVARQVSEVAGNVAPPDEVLDQVSAEARRQLRREMRRFNDSVAADMALIALHPAHHDAKYFVCGHTHIARVVPIGESKYYINTGTWTEIIYDVATMQRQEQRFPFFEVTYPDGDAPDGRLMVWNGPADIPSVWQDEPMPTRRRLRTGMQQTS